jgi:RimJ/RimL family protein N-acetyltransferase
MLDSMDLSYKPLTLSQYGIVLRRMAEADMEQIRQGRNREFVRNRHVYRNEISKDDQALWYQEMNSPLNYVFVVHYRDQDIGSILVKDFLPDLSTTSCGAFIWNEGYLGTKVPILSILVALDFFFHRVGIACTRSVVLKSNAPSINMNRFFGFAFSDYDEQAYNIFMDRPTYMTNRERLISFACRASKSKETHILRISGSQSNANLPIINSLLISKNFMINA